MVMAGRRIPLADVLKVQERLAQHYRDTERVGKNKTEVKQQ